MSNQNSALVAALSSLIILQLVMLVALFAKSPPHPPSIVSLFAIGPFLGASLAIATSSIIMNPASRTGAVLAITSAIFALLSFGPHKYFDAQFPHIWPAVIGGQIAALVIFYQAIRGFITTSKHGETL